MLLYLAVPSPSPWIWTPSPPDRLEVPSPSSWQGARYPHSAREHGIHRCLGTITPSSCPGTQFCHPSLELTIPFPVLERFLHHPGWQHNFIHSTSGCCVFHYAWQDDFLRAAWRAVYHILPWSRLFIMLSWSAVSVALPGSTVCFSLPPSKTSVNLPGNQASDVLPRGAFHLTFTAIVFPTTLTLNTAPSSCHGPGSPSSSSLGALSPSTCLGHLLSHHTWEICVIYLAEECNPHPPLEHRIHPSWEHDLLQLAWEPSL